MKGEILMKRILVLCLLTLLALTACGAPSESSSSPSNPYDALLFPSSLSFGMPAVEVEEVLDSPIAHNEKEFDSMWGDSSYDSDVIGGFDEIPLDNYCAICGVT